MYSFDDSMNGDQLTLRPEATAGIVRAVIEHNALYNGPHAAVVRWARCSATSGRRRAATASSTSSTSRRSASPGPDVDAEHDPDVPRAAGATSGLSRAATCASRSTASASPTSARAHRAGADRATSSSTPTRSTTTRSAACTATRCASSTRKNPAMQALVEAAPKLIDFLGARVAARTSTRVQRHARRRRPRLPHQPAPGARPGLLQPAPCSSGSPTSSARRARSAAAAATTG